MTHRSLQITTIVVASPSSIKESRQVEVRLFKGTVVGQRLAVRNDCVIGSGGILKNYTEVEPVQIGC